MNSENKVLLVDDERAILAVLAEVLSLGGYEVMQASNADTALKLLERNTDCDMIITDIQMPGHADGLHLADVAAARVPVVPVVIMSGRPDLLARPLRTSEAFLRKPFGSEQLMAALNSLRSACRSSS